MIRLKSFEAWQWRNRLAEHPAGVAEIETDDASTLEALGAEAIAALAEAFPEVSQDLRREPPARLLAAICLSMQRQKYVVPPLAGATPGGFWFAAADPVYASVSVGGAVAFLNALAARGAIGATQVAASARELVESCEFAALDQTTLAMVTATQQRGIPWRRLNPGVRDVELGHGAKLRRLREAVTGAESQLAAEYAHSKPMTLALLAGAGLPVGRFAAARTADQAASAASAMGFPVVLKPAAGRKGEGVIIGLADAEAVHAAASGLLQTSGQVLVQSFLPGADHRLLVVAGRLVAAARRQSAGVVGDGTTQIGALIEAANLDPRRGTGFRALMNRIEIDDELRRVLAGQGLTLDDIPAAGARVRLRLTANISTGGDSVDVTDSVHPDNAWLAERAARALGLSVSGVDFLTPDISRSWREVGGGVCEVNAGVGLRAHWLADPTRDVVGPILDTIYSPGDDGRIPTALITGSNGKTTTTRMLDHILRAAGRVVGRATTDDVTIGGRLVVEGDFAGVSGAALVLSDPSVTAACLETARGAVLKWGIGVERCDVAALLNISEEQVGIDGIDSLDAMAALKRKVLETAKDAFVFNAEDPRCLAMARDFAPERTILFALNSGHAGLAEHLSAGGTVVTLSERAGAESVVILGAGPPAEVIAVSAIPATFAGKVRHNVANALAAVALAHGMGVAANAIATGLAGFTPSLAHSQGRFNFIDDLPVRALFDYGANAPAIRTAIAALANFPVEGRRIGVVTGVGDRPDDQIDDCARAVAGRFDAYVCFEIPAYRRGRAPGEIVARLTRALADAGVAPDAVHRAETPAEAMRISAALSRPGDLIVVFGSNVRTALPQLRAAFAALGAG
jgi:cyanophycin synthetase